jgi:hypothetical protein
MFQSYFGILNCCNMLNLFLLLLIHSKYYLCIPLLEIFLFFNQEMTSQLISLSLLCYMKVHNILDWICQHRFWKNLRFTMLIYLYLLLCSLNSNFHFWMGCTAQQLHFKTIFLRIMMAMMFSLMIFQRYSLHLPK